ncbi:hypothetical protein D6774_02110 [Candidatus Woesearchaeota archaeon]|jgi:hypothetical protein|nr:MAG: hypothetical protein D6774_02110 [Candidatus Woesearchaeota archaeon]
MARVAPLPGSFMAISIIGFIISWIYSLSGRFSETWGFTLGFVFTLMFIASLISMAKGPAQKI